MQNENVNEMSISMTTDELIGGRDGTRFNSVRSRFDQVSVGQAGPLVLAYYDGNGNELWKRGDLHAYVEDYTSKGKPSPVAMLYWFDDQGSPIGIYFVMSANDRGMGDVILMTDTKTELLRGINVFALVQAKTEGGSVMQCKLIDRHDSEWSDFQTAWKEAGL